MLGNVGAWAQNQNTEKTLTYTFDSSTKDVITNNTYGTSYLFHRWTVSNNDVTIYMGGKIAMQSNMMAMRYKSTSTGEMLGNIDPEYDSDKGYTIPTDATGAIPGNITKIEVTCGGNTSRGIYIYAGKSQIVKDDLDPTGTTFYEKKSDKLTGTNPSVTYQASDGYTYFAITGANSSYSGIKEITITYEPASTDPAINASDVTYAADVTKGEISYTISNASGSTMTATPLTTWIKNVVTLTGPQKVTFDMEENTATEPREGVIELTYGTLTKEVKVTQLAAVAKRTVTIVEPENGTLQILRDGEEVVSGSQVPEGTVLTAVVTPNEGYKFRNWQAVDFVNDEKTTHTYTTSFTYTVGGSDVTFKANFDPIVYTTITWSVNGVTTTEKVEQGTDIAFTAPTTIPEGYVFTGWYGNEYTDATTAPEYVTSATAENDVTYYAVFAKQSGEGTLTTVNVTNNDIATARTEQANGSTSYSTEYNINGWTGKFAFLYEKNGPLYALQLGYNTSNSKSAYNSHLTTPVCESSIKSITIKASTSKTTSGTIYLCSTNEVGAAKVENATYGSGELKDGSVSINVKGDTKQLHIYPSAIFCIESISLTYGESATYSDFRTSVPVTPTTATISISSACTDGSLYYGTFSSTKPFVVSDDIIVSEINITEEGELLVETYETGAVVPANTGVMVSALTGDNYEVELTDEAGTSVLGDFNMLRPTGAGITADQMATADANCLYYRLTMHQGETLGFFWGAADGAAFNVAAGKAYLAVPVTQAARVNGFVLGGGTSTGIDSIADSMAAQRTVYNLAGQRVSGRLAKGVYIVNGKKVIIK